jgi:hypothetical protein
MLNTLYWTLLTIGVVLLAYSSRFATAPLVFVAGGAALGFGYWAFLSRRRRASGFWEHPKYQSRFVGSVFIYIVVFWTTMGLFGNVKEQREFLARYEPYIVDGNPHGYTFHYVDYAGSYERIDSPQLDAYLREKKPPTVRLALELVRDFGRLRAYSVKSVDSIAVNKEWSPDGMPPWDALRSR